MLDEKEISERNGQLISLIAALDLGIHILELPHKPKLISPDYKYWLSAYVKNFHLYLMPEEYSDTPFMNIRLKPIHKMEVDVIKEKVLEWMVRCRHKPIYTLSISDSDLFLVGFNHHNKILRTNPYPVFAFHYPILYYSLEKALEIKKRFKEYDLVVNT